jgi:hypothetical protein
MTVSFVSTIKASPTTIPINVLLNNYLKTDPSTGFIHSVSEDGLPKQWTTSSSITKAVMDSSIAIVLYSNATGQTGPRLYYQDPELYLREHYYDHSMQEWALGEQIFELCRTDSDHISGDFNPGVQPRGTSISAEGIHDGDADINVIWRDARGRAVTSSWSKSSGWDLPLTSPSGGRAPRDGRDSS